MLLSPKQISVITGRMCPYCSCVPNLVDGKDYFTGKSYGNIWLCKPCDAYIGVDKDDRTTPLGRLADKNLRAWKKRARIEFDQLHLNGNSPFTKPEAVDWLAQQLNLPVEYINFNTFSITTCEKIINLCTAYMKTL